MASSLTQNTRSLAIPGDAEVRTQSRARCLQFLIALLAFFQFIMYGMNGVETVKFSLESFQEEDEGDESGSLVVHSGFGNSISLMIQELAHTDTTPDHSVEADPIVTLLKESGAVSESELRSYKQAIVNNVNATSVSVDGRRIPTWRSIASVYGPMDEPIVVGMDTCKNYRDSVPKERRYTAVAGLWNTGTNAMKYQLLNNIKGVRSIAMVPWGKHNLADRRNVFQVPLFAKETPSDCLPVVILKDPYNWMQSMCKASYGEVYWKTGRGRCPNLVFSKKDFRNPRNARQRKGERVPKAKRRKTGTVKRRLQSRRDLKETLFSALGENARQLVHSASGNVAEGDTFEVKTKLWGHVDRFDSLIDLYSQYNRMYLNADFPRLMVRLEDMLVQPKKVLSKVAECVGGEVPSAWTFQNGQAKDKKGSSDFLKTLAKTVDAKKRLASLTPEDLRYMAKALDPDISKQFQYRLIPVDSL